jgi:hypothetical protein
MKFRILLTTVIILAGSMVFQNYQTAAANPQPSAEQEAAILASTLQMAMFEFAPAAGGAEPGSRGLGTLVTYRGKTYIITHDHWAHLTPNLHEVELRNAMGELLLTLDARAFRALIAYRDGGTMVLRAPAGLPGLLPAAFGRPAGEEDTVWFARRSATSGRTTVEVVAATVTELEDAARPARMRLRTVDGSAIVPGDSGGGAWANGKLVGNLWAAGVSEPRTFWGNLFGGNEGQPSDLVIAALHPLGPQADADVAAQIGAGSGRRNQDIEERPELLAKDDQLQEILLTEE